MNVVILTPIHLEHEAMIHHLSGLEKKVVAGSQYLIGSFKGKYNSLNIVTQQAGVNNEVIALSTEKAIQHFQPIVIILAGIAGGVKDVAIGDVVVGTKYYGYEFGKETIKGFVARPESGYYSQELQTLARSVSNNDCWLNRIDNNSTPKVIFGPIASGNKVLASTESKPFQLLQQFYNDTTAVDMEAIGFGYAMQFYPTIRYLNIRGISDLLDNKSKSDGEGSQELAAANMAAFVFELLYQLDVSQFKIIGMEIKELAKQIVDLMVPVAKETSVNEQVLEEGMVQELFQKVKPLFKEEFKALQINPDDPDLQADARSVLRHELKKKKQLQTELSRLVDKVIKEKSFNMTVIENNDTVIHGNKITVQGNMHIGDIINAHLEGEKTNEAIYFTAGDVEKIKALISRGQIEEAIDLLLYHSKKLDQNTFNEVISIARQWEELQRDSRIGVLSTDEKSRWASRITFNLLSSTDTLQSKSK